MAAGGAEEHFAKKLANNEKKIRDRAVNKLRAWIRSRPKDGPGFDEVDLLKIWKGLFYCMWMSDKPLIQEELASNLSQLVLNFRNERSAVLFIKTFFKTMQREWHGIDRLRLDKFYLLIRFFVKETFNLLKKGGWQDRLVTEVSSIFQEEPLNPTSQAVPDGIRLHMVAVYLAELKSVVDDQVTSDVLQKLLDPLFCLAAHSNNKTVTNAVRKSLFEHLVQSDTNESDEKQGTFTNKVDFATAADRLFTLASDREILGRNRNQLFDWAKRLRKCSKDGEHKDEKPVQEGGSLNGIPVASKRKAALCESSEITNSVIEDDDGKKDQNREEKSKRKKKKYVEMDIGQENGSCGSNVSEDDKKEKKRKRKNKEQNLGNNVSSVDKEVTVDEEVKDEPKQKKKKKIVSDKIENSTISKKHAKCDESNIEESVIVNGSSNRKDVPQTNKSPVNGTSAVNSNTTGTLENSDHTSSTVEKKALQKATSPKSEPFAKFQKNSTPPAFVRKCVPKTPRTEPPRSKKSDVKDQTPGSVPAKGTRKRVRIEMSKNTAHTTKDYQRSLKESPKIPFDAQKIPTQGLLKSPPLPRRTPLHVKKNASSTDRRQRQQNKSKTPQRPKAVDFF